MFKGKLPHYQHCTSVLKQKLEQVFVSSLGWAQQGGSKMQSVERRCRLVNYITSYYVLYASQICSFTLKNFPGSIVLLILLVFCSPLAMHLGTEPYFCEPKICFKGWTHQGTQEAGLLQTLASGRVIWLLTPFLASTCPKFPGILSVRYLQEHSETAWSNCAVWFHHHHLLPLQVLGQD